MGTLNAFYIKCTADQDQMAAIVSERFPDAEVDKDTQFWAVILSSDNFKVPEGDLTEISSRLGTDVIWLSYQSVVDGFQYHHWCEGERVRSLVYGCFEQERTWERV